MSQENVEVVKASFERTWPLAGLPGMGAAGFEPATSRV